MIARETVVKALHSPLQKVLRFALTYATLTDDELEVIERTYINGKTEETAAEEMNVSPEFIAKKKAKAIKKLQAAWEFCEVIPILTR